jgi:flagellin-like hook-associated protein FlgL
MPRLRFRSPSPVGDASAPRPRTAALGLIAAAAVVGSLLIGSVARAAGPVTVGYQDKAYGGALATRPTSDPEQSKLWYNDGAWWGGLFVSSGSGSGGSHFNNFKFLPGTHSWQDTGRQIDIRDLSHADYLWDGAASKLYVASSKSICTTVPAPPTQGCNDQIRVYRYSYNAGAATLALKYTLDAGFPKVLAGAAYAGGNFTGGGSNAVTIAKDSTGHLWLTYTRDDPTTAAPPITGFHSNVYLSDSADGATWTAPARFAAAADGQLDQDNTAAIVSFGTSVGLYWTDKHASGSSPAFFAVHNDIDPVGTWSAPETVTTGTNAADNQVNLKADAAGKVYAIIKTDVADQIKLFDRTPGSPGTWSSHPVWTSGNDNTRAQVVIDDEHDIAYAFSATGGTIAGTIYVKSAPLSTLSFPTGKGAPFISSATDHAIDDITLTKQTVDSTTGIIGEASDRLSFWQLHGELALPSADATAPTGTVAINAGAGATATNAVTLGFTASDVGIGVNVVRVANTSSVDGNNVLNGSGASSFSFTSTIPWTLSGGDGTKTVYAQFQDGAGNWSTPLASDDIVLDTTGPVGSVTINGGAGTSNDTTVTLDVTATDASTTVSNVRIANAGTLSGGVLSDASAVTSAYTASKSWTLTAGPDGPRTVYVQWQDAVGNWSGVSTDGITVADTTPPVGTVAINGGAAGVHSLAATCTFPATSADVTQVKISTSPSLSGASFQAFGPSLSCPLAGTLTNGAVKTIYVVFKDGAGNESGTVSDSAVVDTTKPALKGIVTTWLVAGTTVGSTTSLKASWPAATDTITGVGSYRVWVSKDGAPYTFVGTTAARSATIAAYPFHNYRFKVYAIDRAGNFSASIYSPLVRPTTYQNTSTAIVYRGTWATVTSPLYLGGSARYTGGASASASLRFTGRSVGWVATLGPTRGYARVYIDGKLISTVNLHSATGIFRRVAFTKTWTVAGTHTIRIVNLATSGHPRADVDAIMVLR